MKRPTTSHCIACLAAVALTASACESDSDDTAAAADTTSAVDSGGAVGDSSSSSGDETAVDLDELLTCDAPVTYFIPLKSPLYDPEQGGLIEPTQDTYVIHTTRIFVKEESSERFFALSAQIIQEELANAEGLIAFGIGQSACNDDRTIAIWASEEAMYRFVGSPMHAAAMAEAKSLSTIGSVTHWTATVDEVNALSWEVADEKVRAVEPSPLYDGTSE